MRAVVSGLLVAVFLPAATPSAQVISGEIFGKVTDQTDAVLPGQRSPFRGRP